MVRGKFVVQSRKSFQWSPTAVQVELMAQMDNNTEENRRFAKATPSGSITITIDNPPAAAYFTLGKTVYVDFSEAPA